MARHKGNWVGCLCIIWERGITGRGADGGTSMGPEEEQQPFPVGSQRIGREKVPLQFCRGDIWEGFGCELVPSTESFGT